MTVRPISQGPGLRAQQRSTRLIVMLVAGASGVVVAGLAGLASAASPSSLATANIAALNETVVVNSRGLTVYELRPESAHHLLCTKANGCFQIWRPVTARSAKTKLTAAPGVRGALGELHRNGILQVTLGGRPLYRFAGDGSSTGVASGQGIHSFHGTWHVVVTARGATPSTPTMTTPTTTTPTTPTTTTPYYPPLPLY